MVPMVGLEPTRLAALDFESSMSAIPSHRHSNSIIIYNYAKIKSYFTIRLNNIHYIGGELCMAEDKRLIKLAKNGDIEAFEKLVNVYQSKVYNLAYKMFGNPEDASDLAQEALIKIYRNISTFKEESQFSTWIYRIAYNLYVDELRKRKKVDVQSIDEQYDDSSESKITIIDNRPTPEQSLENKEKTEIIHNAIDKLSAEHKSAIILRDIDGHTYDEIAIIQSCSLGTVKSRINRARSQLKDIKRQKE